MILCLPRGKVWRWVIDWGQWWMECYTGGVIGVETWKARNKYIMSKFVSHIV